MDSAVLASHVVHKDATAAFWTSNSSVRVRRLAVFIKLRYWRIVVHLSSTVSVGSV
ncbi:hypothetical protein RBSWK_05794 [Rhodopirellula baltica SWK14]|uniref:Uncharacterized protein n=1 Tax=Rhodopirellula baltica SWK14 TaxID=993516 RepID=L7C9E4_RHOBT|nr:hypothetical protein RBSWK_05794 [Rhodopirellula baltica SWK14]